MKIKSVTTYTSSFDAPETNYKSSYIAYNHQGNVVEAAEWTGDEELESKTVTNYNPDNKIAEEYNYSQDGEIAEHLVYERTDDGTLKKITVHYADGSVSGKIFSYGQENTKTIKIYNESDEEEGSEFYKYDDKGNLIEKLIYNFAGNMEEHKKIIYGNDKIVKEMQFDKSGNILSTQDYYYDSQNNLVELTLTNNKNKIVEKVTTSYDEQNRIVVQHVKDVYLIKISYDDALHTRTEERYNQGNMQVYYLKTCYNDQNLITEEETHTTRISYKYEFFDEN